LTVVPAWVAELRGITLPDVGVRILDAGKVLATRQGSLLFAHFGLSGPVVLDVSRVVSGHPEPQRLVAEIDLLPALREDEIAAWLRKEAAASGKRQLASLIAARLPRRLCDTLLHLSGLTIDRLAAGLRRQERARLVQQLKRLAIALTGTLGFKKAEVTAGGIALSDVDSRTMQSKKAANLFVAGEVLDLDGPIGGYNFQAAWSTGWLAGSSV
jgi:predicted Rossmann fold flavoprotein